MATTTIKETVKEPSAIATRDPFTALREMQRTMMRSFFEPLPLPRFELETIPTVNVKEQDGAYLLECSLPGYKKEDVTVELSGDAVTISGTYKEETNDEKAHYHRREHRQGSFARTIELPAEIDADRATAAFENGMLKLTLPAAKVSTRKTIPIAS